MNILNHFQSLFLCLHTFGVKRSIDILDPENQPGSSAKNFIQRILNVSLRSRYRALDPNLVKKQIHTTIKNTFSVTYFLFIVTVDCRLIGWLTCET